MRPRKNEENHFAKSVAVKISAVLLVGHDIGPRLTFPNWIKVIHKTLSIAVVIMLPLCRYEYERSPFLVRSNKIIRIIYKTSVIISMSEFFFVSVSMCECVFYTQD